MVIVDVPEFPAETVTLVAFRENPGEELEPVGHAANKLKKSTDPRPVASSYPVVAGYSESPALEQ
jgi:hypothetical protein